MSQIYGIRPGQRMGEDFRFQDGSYSSFHSFDINFLNLPVYRADTKEEFVTDLLLFAGTAITGGLYSGFRFAIAQLESD
jgi:hypothetical protein